MKTKILLKTLQTALEADDFATLDTLLTEFYATDHENQDMSSVEEILTEITLYSELKESEYKEKALELLAQ